LRRPARLVLADGEAAGLFTEHVRSGLFTGRPPGFSRRQRNLMRKVLTVNITRSWKKRARVNWEATA